MLRRIAAGVMAVACACEVPLRRTAPAVAGGAERIAYGRDAARIGDLRVPPGAGPHPVVVLLHGGYWLAQYDLDLMTPLAEALTREGFATWNVEYRGLGADGGGWPNTIADVGAAVDHLRALAGSHGLDLGRVTAVGHSAGGQLALWLAARARVPLAPLRVADPLRIGRIVALAPLTDLRLLAAGGSQPVLALLDGTPEAHPERYAACSPLELLPLGVPQVVIHGTDDGIVPIAASVRYVETARARGDDARLVRLEGLDHFAPIDPSSPAWPAVLHAVHDGG